MAIYKVRTVQNKGIDTSSSEFRSKEPSPKSATTPAEKRVKEILDDPKLSDEEKVRKIFEMDDAAEEPSFFSGNNEKTIKRRETKPMHIVILTAIAIGVISAIAYFTKTNLEGYVPPTKAPSSVKSLQAGDTSVRANTPPAFSVIEISMDTFNDGSIKMPIEYSSSNRIRISAYKNNIFLWKTPFISGNGIVTNPNIYQCCYFSFGSHEKETLYIATKDSNSNGDNVYALYERTGEIRWHFEVPGKIGKIVLQGTPLLTVSNEGITILYRNNNGDMKFYILDPYNGSIILPKDSSSKP